MWVLHVPLLLTTGFEPVTKKLRATHSTIELR